MNIGNVYFFLVYREAQISDQRALSSFHGQISTVKKSVCNILKIATYSGLHYIGSVFPHQKVFKNTGPTVIYYHRVHRDENPYNAVRSLSICVNYMEEQIRYLKNNWNIVSLSQIVDHYTKKIQLRCNSIAITFDDGFKDNYDLVYPILIKYKVPATVFLTTHFIGTNRLLWWDRIVYILKNLSLNELEKIILDNDVIPASIKQLMIGYKKGDVKVDTLINSFKRLSEMQRTKVIERVEKSIDKDFFSSIPRQFLSWGEIREMHKNGITFGSHTRTHPILSQVTLDQAKEEIDVSKNEIEKKLSQSIYFFAYPDGVLNRKIAELVKKAGYTAGFQTVRYDKEGSYDIFFLPRLIIKETRSRSLFGRFSETLFVSEISGAMRVLSVPKLRKDNPYQ